MSTLGARLRMIREELGYSKQKMAEYLGISLQTCRRYESDENSPTADFCISLCQRENINIQWLLTGEGPMKGGVPVPTSPSTPSKASTPAVDGATLVNEILMKSAIIGTLVSLEKDGGIQFSEGTAPLKVIVDTILEQYFLLVATMPPDKRPTQDLSVDAIELIRKIPSDSGQNMA